MSPTQGAEEEYASVDQLSPEEEKLRCELTWQQWDYLLWKVMFGDEQCRPEEVDIFLWLGEFGLE